MQGHFLQASRVVMIAEKDFKRLCWASRRGMLELDLILVPFVENCFKTLSAEDQQRYIDLLESEDTELFAWFLGRQLPDDEDLRAIIALVIEYSKTRPLDL